MVLLLSRTHLFLSIDMLYLFASKKLTRWLLYFLKSISFHGVPITVYKLYSTINSIVSTISTSDKLIVSKTLVSLLDYLKGAQPLPRACKIRK